MKITTKYNLYKRYTRQVLKVTPLDFDEFVKAWEEMNEKRQELLLGIYQTELRKDHALDKIV